MTENLVITGRQRPASIASGSTLPDPVIQSKHQHALPVSMDYRGSHWQLDEN